MKADPIPRPVRPQDYGHIDWKKEMGMFVRVVERWIQEGKKGDNEKVMAACRYYRERGA